MATGIVWSCRRDLFRHELFYAAPGWIAGSAYICAQQRHACAYGYARTGGRSLHDRSRHWEFQKGKSWLLLLNGLACSALGLIFTFWTGPLAFRTVALLIVLMAMSIGIYELATARTLRRHLADEWLLGAAGVASVGFASVFFAFVFRWIKLEPGSPAQTLHWLGSYFGFSAICMLGLALRLHSLGLSQSGQWEDLSPLGIVMK